MDEWPVEAVERVRALEAENAELRGQLLTQGAQIAALQERLGLTSMNSSKPPANDGPQVKRPRGRPSKRRRGGQPGHAGHKPAMVAPAEVDRIVALRPCQCVALRDCAPTLWALLLDPQIEATNNVAERRLRCPVIKRKLSFGTQSNRGSRYIERAYSADVTLREQRRPVLPFLADALYAHLVQAEPPSLLPAFG